MIGVGGISTGAILGLPERINLLPHSDDPAAWPTSVLVGITNGAAVADPLGGTSARALTFAADSGRIYANASFTGPLSGRTFTASVYVRAPSGKARIVVAGNSDTQYVYSDVILTPLWQRISRTVTCGASDTVIRLALENRAGAGASDILAGVVEVFGGMIQEAAAVSTYERAL